MDKEDVLVLDRLLEKYGPEVLLVFVKGYCTVKATQIRKKTVEHSVFALGYDLIAKSISKMLNETQKDKK